MRFYESEATINASPDAVWAVLTDTGSWSKWDSGVISVEGTPAQGAKLILKSAVAPDRTFPLKVAELSPPNRMVFAGGTPGIFRGIRTYTVTPQGGGSHFRMREEYTGLMVGMIWKSMPDLGSSFRQFAAGLKLRVESSA